MVTFQQEKATERKEEVKPLIEAHWAEVAPDRDIALDPDWDAYAAAEQHDTLRTYSVRDDGKLVGYALFFVHPDQHSKGSKVATNDLLYVDPEHRTGFGAGFILWCNSQLRAEGVQVVRQHVTLLRDFGRALEALGYTMNGTLWSRRLDR